MHYSAPTFSFELPPGSIDASTYAFVYPEIGGNNPARLSVSTTMPPAIPDLGEYLAEQRAVIAESYENVEVLETVQNVRGTWHYVILKFRWASQALAQIHKEIHLFVDAQPLRMYRFIGTAPEADFETAEPIFDKVLGSFKPVLVAPLVNSVT